MEFTGPSVRVHQGGRHGGDVEDVDFPAEALRAEKLQELRLELAYIPSPYDGETVKFIVAIGGQQTQAGGSLLGAASDSPSEP